MITEYSEYPSFDQYFMPVLETYKGGKSISEHDAKRLIYEKYYKNYSLETTVGKSNEPLIYGRAHWALYFLFAGKYLERVSKGTYRITEKGKDFLKKGKNMTLDFLREDKDFSNSSFCKKNKKDKKQKNNQIIDERTPEEIFHDAYKEIEAPKKADLLQRLREIQPYGFERIVGALCEAMGYGTFVETPKSHDGGIDGIIKGDSLGFEKIYIQAKRYAEGNVVNEKEMRDFIGALGSSTVRKAIFFTTSTFAPKAKEAADNASKKGNDILLIEGTKLVELMFKYNVGVQVREVYEIKNIDEDFFEGFN